MTKANMIKNMADMSNAMGAQGTQVKLSMKKEEIAKEYNKVCIAFDKFVLGKAEAEETEEETVKEFKAGKKYITWTQSGESRLFVVSAISKCGQFVKASYNGNPEKAYKINKDHFGNEWIAADDRVKTIITPDEAELYKEGK